MMDFSTMLQDMVRSTPTPSLHSEDRQETPKNKNKREDNLMNEIGLAVKRR